MIDGRGREPSLAAHAAGCPDCASAIRLTERLSIRGAEARARDLDPDTVAATCRRAAAVLGEQAGAGAPGRWAESLGPAWAAAAAAALLLLAGGVFLGRKARDEAGSQAAAGLGESNWEPEMVRRYAGLDGSLTRFRGEFLSAQPGLDRRVEDLRRRIRANAVCWQEEFLGEFRRDAGGAAPGTGSTGSRAEGLSHEV